MHLFIYLFLVPLFDTCILEVSDCDGFLNVRIVSRVQSGDFPAEVEWHPNARWQKTKQRHQLRTKDLGGRDRKQNIAPRISPNSDVVLPIWSHRGREHTLAPIYRIALGHLRLAYDVRYEINVHGNKLHSFFCSFVLPPLQRSKPYTTPAANCGFDQSNGGRKAITLKTKWT